MSPVKLTQKTWLLFILPTIGIIVLFVFMSRPKFKEIKDLNAKIEKAKTEMSALQQTARTKEDLIKEISAMREAIEYYEKRIPSEKGIPWLLKELSRVARETGIRYVSITPMSEERSELFVKIPMSVQIKCGYHSLGRYLSKIESSQRFMTVDDISISPDGSNPLKHNVTLKISTFMLAK